MPQHLEPALPASQNCVVESPETGCRQIIAGRVEPENNFLAPPELPCKLCVAFPSVPRILVSVHEHSLAFIGSTSKVSPEILIGQAGF